MPVDAPDGRPTVLVVDDETLVAMLVSDVLADAGYRPVWTPDGHAASACPEPASTAQAAVVDLRLADGPDGRDVLRHLRARHRACRRSWPRASIRCGA